MSVSLNKPVSLAKTREERIREASARRYAAQRRITLKAVRMVRVADQAGA